jgi:tetracycline 7-halogenase / FADH2 O2-dependent halogenase
VKMKKENSQHDVIVLGSGIGGATLSCILARHGLTVLMIDSGSHPRFAVGEATTPDTSFRMKVVAHKYQVPEIENLSTFYLLRDHVSAACGVKRAFSFLYHREGQAQNPKESHQYPTLAAPMGPDCHFFRQDTDAYMVSVALQYGASLQQQTSIKDVDIQDDRVALTSGKGETFICKYLVDAAGYRSPLADKFMLRSDPNLFRTNSRTIFTHMVGVKLYDQVARPNREYELKYPLSQGTLHHVFKGGWFWIIPFNNHLDAVNPLCSVGVTLDRNLYPETGMDPEEEFFKFVNMHPDIARQFEGAKAARNWVSTGRLQYGSKSVTGRRYFLLAHAGAFIDALYSSGMNLTIATIDGLAKRLLNAFKTDDFSVEQFQDLNDRFLTNVYHVDEFVGSSFVAFQDYELWDAWFRLWVVGLLINTELSANLFLRFLETGDRSVLDQSDHVPYTGVLGSAFTEYRPLFDQAFAEIEKVRLNQAEPKAAARTIRALYRSLTYVPTYFRWDDPKVRSTPAFTLWGVTRMYFWYYFRSPERVRKQLFEWNPITAYKYIYQSVRRSNSNSKGRKSRFLRDVFKAWNTDWREPVSPSLTVK